MATAGGRVGAAGSGPANGRRREPHALRPPGEQDGRAAAPGGGAGRPGARTPLSPGRRGGGAAGPAGGRRCPGASARRAQRSGLRARPPRLKPRRRDRAPGVRGGGPKIPRRPRPGTRAAPDRGGVGGGGPAPPPRGLASRRRGRCPTNGSGDARAGPPASGQRPGGAAAGAGGRGALTCEAAVALGPGRLEHGVDVLLDALLPRTHPHEAAAARKRRGCHAPPLARSQLRRLGWK